MEELKNLNEICTSRKRGIYKQWIYKKEDFMKVCNYMQKINYSIQDLNNLKNDLTTFHPKNVIYSIVLVDWIVEACYKIYNSINNQTIEKFVYSDEELFIKATKYFRAIRSFIVAHPLSTTRHDSFGFDGNYICVDIRNNNGILKFKGERFYYLLDYNGLETKYNEKCDFYLFCYSDKDDNMRFFRIIGCNFDDIYKTARIYIDKLYSLDKFLSKQKKIIYSKENKDG